MNLLPTLKRMEDDVYIIYMDRGFMYLLAAVRLSLDIKVREFNLLWRVIEVIKDHNEASFTAVNFTP